ncbi:transposase [Micrococcus endophyticus]|nr:transposase [Micrococcus endophyticus]
MTLARIAQDFGIHEMTLSTWMRQADIENGEKPGLLRAEATENRELRKRIRLLDQENEVL